LGFFSLCEEAENQFSCKIPTPVREGRGE
jgi:hypothetical protein